MSFVTDYAWARPDPHAIKAAGFVAVCRYLSHDRTGKTLSVPEVNALHAAGLGVVLNFEDSAGRPLAGFGAGVADAQFANQLADGLGAPRDVPIYYSCDTDPGSPPNSAIVGYFKGVQSVGIRPVGAYGGAVLVQALLSQGIIQFGWTANASSWNHGVAPLGHLHQLYSHPDGTPLIAGVAGNQYDTSEILNGSFGAWGGSAVVVAPGPAPTTGGVPTLSQGSRGDAVRLVQALLHIASDGIFGPNTKAAVVAFQRGHGLAADGVVGPRTWAALTAQHSAPAPTPAPSPGRATIKLGSSGPDVAYAQQRLNNKGARLATDGKFGPATDAAVRRFQQNVRTFFHAPSFAVDGIVGPGTWFWLVH